MDDVFDSPLTARVRSALGDRAAREVPMFGGVSFLVDHHILVAARKAGDLLVRIDPGRRDEVLDLPGVALPACRAAGRWDASGSPWTPTSSPPQPS